MRKYLFLIILLLSAHTLLSTTYYVKTNGNNGAAGTSWATAWQTIQKAADTMGSSDLSYVSNGQYCEEINVNSKSSISFIGYGNAVLINGRRTTNYAFRLENCDNVLIQNFEIISNDIAMIFLTNSDYCIIAYNDIHDNDQPTDLGSGIKLIDSCYNNIINNEIYYIEAPITTGHCYGIYLYHSHTNTIKSNVIRESGSGAISGGVDIWCHGIYLLNSDNNLIRFNYLHDMDHWGVHIQADNTRGAPYTFLDNRILDNKFKGMDRAISTHEVQPSISDCFKGQIVGRNEIINTAKGIEWDANITGNAGDGGWCYKNSFTAKRSNFNYLEGVMLADWPKINFLYNSIQGYYNGLNFHNYDYNLSDIAFGSNYSKNILRSAGAGPAQSINYSCTQSGGLGAGLSSGTGNTQGLPLFFDMSNTRLAWNSPCIGRGKPGPDGARGSIGAHTSWLRARNNAANNISTYTLVFVTSPYDGYIPNNAKIKVDFPIGFSFVSPTILTQNMGGSISISFSGPSITFSRTSGATFPTNTPMMIVLTGVYNPAYNSTNYFCTITITSNNGTLIEWEESNHFRVINGINRSTSPDPWPFYMNNRRHTGSTNKYIMGVQRNPFVKWFFNNSYNYSSAVVGADGTVYFGDYYYKVYAVTNGVQKWMYTADERIYATPALGFDNTVYVADNGNKLYAIRNGVLLWSFQATNSFYFASPVVDRDNIVYIGDQGGIVYAVSNGQLKWSYKTNGSIAYCSPAVDTNGTVYIGNSGGDFLAITNGKLRYSLDLTNQVLNSPTIGPDGTIYVATYSWNNSKIYAITNNSTNGGVRWFQQAGQYVYASPTVDDNNIVYLGNCSNYIAAYSNGQIKWVFQTNEDFIGSASIGADGTIYVGNENDYLYALTNGKIKWAYYTGDNIYYSTPAIGLDGTIYIGTWDGMYAITEENPPVLVWSSNTGYSNDGVEPDEGYDGQYFRFEIKYRDQDRDPPSTNQVWVDLNDNGNYESSEKFPVFLCSGSDYSNGVIYTNVVQIFLTGDGTNNYKFLFADEHGMHPVTNACISNHIVVITNTNINHILEVEKNTNLDKLFFSYSNESVLAVRIWDNRGDTLKAFSMGNLGTMTQGIHISVVKVYRDVNTNYRWDLSDSYIAQLYWDGTSLWTNNNISSATPLSFPNYHYIVTVDLTTNVKKDDFIKAYIPSGGVRCSGGQTAPPLALTNQGNVVVGQYLFKHQIGTGVYYSSIVLGDIDGDEDLDVIVSGYDNSNPVLAKYVNNNGFLTGPTPFGDGVRYSSIALGDINADSSLDLIATGYDSSWTPRLCKYINDGNGNFSGPTNFGTGLGYGSIALGDINNDGSLDLVVSGNGVAIDKYINNGTGGFFGPTLIGSSMSYCSISLGDIDNDSDLDIIAAGSSRLEKYINDGKGNFSSAISFGEGLYYCSIALGDINDDGVLDLVTTGYVSAGPYVLNSYINNGHGTFLPPSYFGTGARYGSLALGDINNDGKLDLITSGETTSEGYILKSYINSFGNFIEETSFGKGVYYGSIALGDLNNNGSLDLIVSGRQYAGSINRLDHYRNMEYMDNTSPGIPSNLALKTNNGYYRLEWDAPLDDNTSTIMLQYHVAIGVNQSEVYDYVSTNIDYPRGQANVGNAGAAVSNFFQTTLSTQSKIFWKVCAIDTSFKHGRFSPESFNSNGNHRLIVTKNTDFSTNYPNFFSNTIMSVKISDTYPHQLRSLKFYNNSTMVQGSDIDRVYLWLDDNNNKIWNLGDVLLAELIWNGTYWSNGNINYNLSSDGKDFVVTVNFARSVNPSNFIQAVIPKGGVTCSGLTNAPDVALTNNGLVGIQEGFIGPNTGILPGCNAPCFALGDVDNDGDLDLVANGLFYTYSKSVLRHFNPGDGNFNTPSSFGQGCDRGYLALGDLNNDGYLDLVVTGAGSAASYHYFDRYLNDGAGNFANRVSLYGTDTEGLCESSISLGDMDGDGDLDIIATGSSTIALPDARLEYYTNKGNGNFSTRRQFGTGVYNGSSAIGDIDNDNDFDLIVSGQGRLDRYINDGNGNFTNTITAFGTGMSYCSIAMGDINNDGWVDFVITGNSGGNKLYKYINNQDGTFTGTQIGTTGSSYGAVNLGDIDQDGDLDIVTVGSSRLDKYYNDGTGIFSGPYPFGRGLGTSWGSSAVMGDIDNDGDLDLITGGDIPGTLYEDIYFNIHHEVNTAPNMPQNTTFTSINGKWRLKWDAPVDDHTSAAMLRYKIAIGTNTPNNYNNTSDAVDYPSGQANIGNVTVVTGTYYQTRITNTRRAYWKVLAIDTSYKISWYTPEDVADYFFVHNLTLGSNYSTITNALSNARNGDHIQVDPYIVFREQVNIRNFTNLIIEATYFASNHSMTNTFIHPPANSAYAAKITNCYNVLFQGFTLKYATNGLIINSGESNTIKNNSVFSNDINGLTLSGSLNNLIQSNIVYHNDYGLNLAGSDADRIYRNLIRHNQLNNLNVNGSSSGTRVINNTIFKSATEDGVIWNNTSSGTMFNNIILSNGNGAGDYGVQRSTSGLVYLDYNDFNGNRGGHTNGGFSAGADNTTNNPLLETISSFTISSILSPAMDTGLEIQGISDVYVGIKPDMGWKESLFVYPNSGPYFVDDDIGRDTFNGSFEYPFQTIQRAAQRMMPAVDVTVASCYVYPGVYPGKVDITSNMNTGLMVITKLSNVAPVMNGSMLTNHGIKLTNTSRVLISGLTIKRYNPYGILFQSGAFSNFIIRNTIVSNDDQGIYFNHGTARDNFILTNHIWGYDQNTGIYFNRGHHITIQSNYIFNNSGAGIYFGTASSNNYVIKNNIWSNWGQGIYLGSDTADRNTIISNDIWGRNQDYGIYMWMADRNIIQYNQIHNNQSYGVYTSWDNQTNIFSHNNFYSNESYGIYISDDNSDNNYFLTNTFWGLNQDYGIYINNGDNNKIYRNLFHDNAIYGIRLIGSALDTIIINNTIFGSGTGDGVIWENTSSGTMFNNIIISNGDGAGDYGVQRSTSGIVYLAYNDFFGNRGGHTNGGVIWGPANITNDPMIDMVTSFTIISPSSPCVDTATNIPAITTNYLGLGPDRGWKESPFSKPHPGPYYVDNDIGLDSNPGTFVMPFRTIQKAANTISAGPPLCTIASCYIYPGAYSNSVNIASNKNNGYMVITKLSNARPLLTGWGKFTFAFKLTNAGLIKISGLDIKRYTDGIVLKGFSTNTVISNNVIYSNIDNGILLFSDYADRALIISNILRGGLQDTGVYIYNADHCDIRCNQIYGNDDGASLDSCGIYLIGTAWSNVIVKNHIYNNRNGILFNSTNADYNFILTNYIYNSGGNQNYGIQLHWGDYNTIRSNFMYLNTVVGMELGYYAETNYIIQNSFYNNSWSGIRTVWHGDNNIILSNNISGQVYGIRLRTENNLIRDNKIHDHSNAGIMADPGFQEHTRNNYIARNQIFSNRFYGIRFEEEETDNNFILSNYILGPEQSRGIYIIQGDNNTMRSNYIFLHKTNGIYIGTDSSNNYMSFNDIISNDHYGIWINHDNADYNLILTNHIWGQNQDYGILLSAGDNNTISSNHIYRNADRGIFLSGSAQNNFITKNLIFYNGTYGIRLSSYTVANNYILSNNFWGVQAIGIYLEFGKNNVINDNKIHNQYQSGISLSGGFGIATNNYFARNSIYSNDDVGIGIGPGSINNYIYTNALWGENQDWGINFYGGKFNTIESNHIYKNNLSGINFWGGGVASTNTIIKNLIFSNNNYGIFFNEENADYNYIISNICFSTNQDCQIKIDQGDNNEILYNIIREASFAGLMLTNNATNTKIFYNRIVHNNIGINMKNTTTASLFRNAIFGNSREGILLENGDNVEIINNSLGSNGYVATRDGLKVNSSSEDIIIKNNIIIFCEGYGVNVDAGGNVDLLAYNDVFSNLAGNYNGITPGAGTITNHPLWLSYQVNSSNFLYLSNQSPCIDAGDPADTPPVDGGLYIDMGWKEFTRPFVRVLLSKSITNIQLGGLNEDAIPGASIEYKLGYHIISYGNENVDRMIIYDRVDPNTTYSTGYLGTATGLTQEYSTNDDPDQGYNSANYDRSMPEKNKIKWVRWKKISEGGGTQKTIFLKITIK
ncbi:MAG: right-handed parallel beta-helix repeat-containing protein [Spirochaetes bacterium]|nr:right-handed parallel beta-helix repeat-containing protein [Spirochaetota bacterium]